MKRLSFALGPERRDILGIKKAGEEGAFTVRFSGGSVTADREVVVNGIVEGKQVGGDLVRWVSAKGELDDQVIYRWGICNPAPTTADGGDSTLYQIRRVVFASGERHGWKSGRYYGSSVRSGGANTFHLIEFHSLSRGECEAEEPGSPVMSDIEENISEPYSPRIRILSQQDCRDTEMIELDDWCVQNPDKFRRLNDRPGARGPSIRAGEFLMGNSPIFCHSPNDHCLRASLANGLHLLGGPQDNAALIMLQKGRISAKSLAEAGCWLELSMRRYYLKNPNFERGKPSVEWVMRQDRGIFLVRLKGIDALGELIDHAVVVDAGARMVLDPAERFAMRMKDGVLDVCVGDGCRLTEISEVKELCHQAKGGGKRKAHKMSKEKQRARRQKKRAQIDLQKSVAKKSHERKHKVVYNTDED